MVADPGKLIDAEVAIKQAKAMTFAGRTFEPDKVRVAIQEWVNSQPDASEPLRKRIAELEDALTLVLGYAELPGSVGVEIHAKAQIALGKTSNVANLAADWFRENGYNVCHTPKQGGLKAEYWTVRSNGMDVATPPKLNAHEFIEYAVSQGFPLKGAQDV